MSPVKSCFLVAVICMLAANAGAYKIRDAGTSTRSHAAFVPQATDDQALHAKEPITHKVNLPELQSVGMLYEDSFDLDTEPDKLTISSWYSRGGNNFFQLIHALILAAMNDKKVVSLATKGPLWAIYDLPGEIPVPQVDSQFKQRQQSGCPSSSPPTGQFYFRHCSGVSRSDYMYMADHLRQYFKMETAKSCRAEDARKEDELIIHLRSGDLMSSSHFQSKFAPCGFFEHLIKQHKYSVVRIITEPDLQNPCVSFLQELKSEKVVVQSHSVAEDACALMNARHLAVNALSTFSITFGMIANHNLKTLHMPFKLGSQVEPANSNFDESSAHDVVGYFHYSVPGIDQIRFGAQKNQYLRSIPESQITLVSRSDLSSVLLEHA